ncbi:SRS domain-containing protein [Neospora caninum Liverpool]|uniref:SRS domain-containing protein n=1 Tax=Neospora caninum (strain Liverpool) TaxID=572307 RepID=F0VKJ6_NEOCL|nr:SRS domain-containing protein [Neospora caninum Liverpool]CBZ54597.1 SRS domain-containing protein [Neospora caninum Liverpool]CEL69311.1 TPA: SRS domain-containing protein [Neospora caninum Liverpool]|eukprot:XP_003884627.1 SRS domain-containing protein [Neospora caninum Liverpool]
MTQNPGAFKTATTVAAGRRTVFCRRLCLWLSASFLVVFVCSFRVQYSDAEKNECKSDKSVLQLVAKDATPVDFTCGNGVSYLYPPYRSEATQVCRTSACTDVVGMSLTNVSLVSQSNGLSITTTDVQQASTIYFQCTDTATETHLSRLDSKPPAGRSSSKKACTVQISIWGPPKQGFSYPVPNNGPLRLEITSASQSVTFACGNDQNLTPKLFDQICQSDGCESTAPLADTLAGASLVQHASPEGNPNTPAYTLTVPQLPDESQTLFYKCATGTDKDARAKDCNVVITVAKAADGDGSSGPSSDTTTIPPETSGTGAERWSKSLAFSVFSVALLLTKMI